MQAVASLQTEQPACEEPVTLVLVQLLSVNEVLHRQPHVHAAGDVGLARIMEATHLATGLAPCGTFAYAAPEMLMGNRCSEKVGAAVWHTVTTFNATPMFFSIYFTRCGCSGCLAPCGSMHFATLCLGQTELLSEL